MTPRPDSARRRKLARAALRLAAGGAVAGAFVVPLRRHRWRVPHGATVASLVAGPVGLAVLRPRTRSRDAVLFAMQMWAFLIAHELPYDSPDGLRRRLKVRYPIVFDRVVGAGRLPNVRLQEALGRPGEVTRLDRFLTWAHWLWFFEPHLALLWILVTDTDRFPRAARQMSAAFDIGCLGYFAVPTAPPWWAAENGHVDGELRRVMVEVGEETWGKAWPAMYESLGGNPWAAMPSLHFATSLLAAKLLAESGRLRGTAGYAYAGTLGFALVYLGEHYVCDLAAGAALVALVRRGEPHVEPAALALSRAIQRLERSAR